MWAVSGAGPEAAPSAAGPEAAPSGAGRALVDLGGAFVAGLALFEEKMSSVEPNIVLRTMNLKRFMKMHTSD